MQVELEKAKRALARSKEPQPSEFPTYAQHADAVAKQLCCVHGTTEMLGDRVHAGAEIYRTLQSRCVHFTYSMLNTRLLHKSVELLDCRAEVEVRRSETALTGSHLLRCPHGEYGRVV
jgi:hypothetical protein